MDSPAVAVPTQSKPRHANQTPPSITRANQNKFLELLALTGEFRPSCDAIGISYNSPYQWAIKSDAFAKRLDAARAAGEKVLLDRYEEQIDKRVFMGSADPQSAVLTMFRTKRLDPRYRDNAVLEINAKGPVAVQLNFGALPQVTHAATQADDNPSG